MNLNLLMYYFFKNNFFNKITKMSHNQNKYKIILLGESSVGKSSILNRLTHDSFSDINVSTISEFYTNKEMIVKGKKMNLQIWDTAGEERYRSIVKNYFIGCTAAILVYDITNKNTFNLLKDFWYNEIIKFNPNISMYK